MRRRCAAIATVALAGALVAPSAVADDVTDRKKAVDQQISQLNESLEGTSAKLITAYSNLRQTQAELPSVQAALSLAEADLSAALSVEAAAIARRDEVTRALALARADEQRAVAKQTQNAGAVAASQDTLDAYAADIFQSDGQSQLAVALGAQSPDEFAERMITSEAVTSAADRTLSTLQAAQADGDATTAYLKAVRAEVATLKAQADAAAAAATTARANADAARDTAAQAKAQVDSLIATQQALTTELATEKAIEEKRLKAAQAEQAQLKAVLVERARVAREKARLAELERQRLAKLKNKGKNTKPPVVVVDPGGGGGGGFRLLTPPGGYITSGFGMRFHPVLHIWKLHDGLDFGMPCGTPVYASAAGTVFKAGYSSTGWGNQIMIDHGIQRGVGLVTTYNHLSQIIVYGGGVARGQLIGYSGTTGYSTGCHLHLGVYVEGVPVNPLGWL